jgi:NAD(P)-dependent dehydrogenase (short-subunit alcohol dehydrogenase family)
MENTQKTAIVTGASQGIGAGAVEAFLQRGYRVVANSRNLTKANPFPASADLALAGCGKTRRDCHSEEPEATKNLALP